MHYKLRDWFSGFRSRNLKSAMQNRKCLPGLCALVFTFALCGTAFPAQQSAKIPRIGFLIIPLRSFFSARLEGFHQGLRNLGYIEGKNILPI